MGIQLSKLNCQCLFPIENKKTVEDKLDKNHNHSCNQDQTGLAQKKYSTVSVNKNDLSGIKSGGKYVEIESITMRDLPSIPAIDREINDKIMISTSEKNNKLSLSIDEGMKIKTQSSRYTLFTKQLTTSFRSNQTEAGSSLSIRGNFLLNEGHGRYYGQVVNNRKEGVGTVVWSNGSKFQGLFINNRAYGIGKYTDSNGAVFVGEYENNRPLGWGHFRHTEGFRYEGTWVGNSQENIGLELWPDNTLYQGEYYKGKKQGIGIYKWPDGTIYEGDWNDNAINGYGILYFKDQRIYMGELSKGLMHGYGEFYWPDGKKYIGCYVQNEKDGFGIFIWSLIQFKVYVGFWHNGEQHGIGLIMHGNNLTYGYWFKGKKEISFKSLWDMKKYAKDNSITYNVIFEKNIRETFNLV